MLVLGLVGTTVVPYNLFLGSGLSAGQSLQEMRTGLVIAVVLGGLISMAVLVTGTAIRGEFSFELLADALNTHLGGAGRLILGFGLMAAGFTSAVTAPLASAVTARSLFSRNEPERWHEASLRFRMVWLIILLSGMGFGMAGFRPVPAIILAQALNGILLPVVSVYLLYAVNNARIMGSSVNTAGANLLLVLVVFCSLLLGLTGLSRALIRGLGLNAVDWNTVLYLAGFASLFLMIIILIPIRNARKNL
jgi:Mn2+/Fe2+ NRAMP family transporter